VIPPALSSRLPAAIAWLSLAAAAVLGLGLPAERLAGAAPPPFSQLPVWADDFYDPVRPRFAPGERVGILLVSGDPNGDGALHYGTQYALAPALIEPIYLGDCLKPERGPRCRVETVQRVLLVTQNPRLLDFAMRGLGLAPREQFGDLYLLERVR